MSNSVELSFDFLSDLVVSKTSEFFTTDNLLDKSGKALTSFGLMLLKKGDALNAMASVFTKGGFKYEVQR